MRVFAKRFWGFDPTRWPIISFGLEGNRDALVRNSSPGDLIGFVGTFGIETSEDERGKLLGLAEIGRIAIDSADVLDLTTLAPHNFDSSGKLKWPKALPMLRAWEFVTPPLLTDVLKQQLTYEATVRAVLLDDDDARALLALPRREIAFAPVETVAQQRALYDAIGGGPTTGPRPVSWSGEVSRDAAAAAFTYAFRFGRRDLWKIGHAKDVAGRLADVNKHVPHEVLQESWQAVLQHRWNSEGSAYDMEQRLLRALRTSSSVGERVQCTKDQLEAAWFKALIPQPV